MTGIDKSSSPAGRGAAKVWPRVAGPARDDRSLLVLVTEALYPFGLPGHFNAAGTALIAAALSEHLPPRPAVTTR